PPLAVAANGAWVAAMDDTGGIRVWNPKDGTGPVVERLTALSEPDFSADGAVASALTPGGRIVLFDPATGVPKGSFETGLNGEYGVAWSHRAGLVAGVGKVGEDAELHVVDVVRKNVVVKIPVSNAEGIWFAFSPVEPTRLGVFSPGTATVYDIPTGRQVRSFHVGQPDTPKVGALSPDGRLVAITTSPAGVWEVATGRKRFDVEGLAEPGVVVFSPDGRRLAVAEGNEVVLADLRTGARRRFHVNGSDTQFTAVAFSPDGRRVATGTTDGVTTLWDAATGEEVVVFDRHEGPVTGIAFSPDGARVLTTSFDGTGLIWDATARPAAIPAAAGADEAVGLLASADPAAAHRGIAFLYRTPDEAVGLLAARVPVPTAVPAARIARLVADLGSPEYPIRMAAVKELEVTGAEAGPALTAAVAATPSPEVRRLAGDVLNRLTAPPTRPEDLRVIRAVEVLEGIGSQAARDVLTKWAAGPANHRLTTEAAAALRRLTGTRPPG
ncbi:MAG TPA: hypothetical protein VH092_15105, partial [Urbifossiella sp.]|nr:hypothetical protein [Urbifossiella sp.]